MREIYRLISKYQENNECIIVSGIKGNITGEKLLFVGGEAIYKSQASEQLQICADEISETGIYDTEEGQVFAERLTTDARLIICGAGTVGQEVIKLGKQLGLNVIVLEDRREFAEIASKHGADKVLCMEFEQAFDKLEQRDSDYYVVVTREHQFDKLCIRKILNRKNSYVGMMSSRNRATMLKDNLKDEGYSEECLGLIHSPIGINIKAETPAEIAVSVMAEIISYKNEKVKTEGYNNELLNKINTESEEKLILATIVKRTGSAPRDVGTKMLIYENGSIVGSVGGGWIEANVLKLAKEMFMSNRKYSIYETDKNSEDAILCGGYETIYLEMI